MINKETDVVIPKSDTKAGPGIINLNEALQEIQNPLEAFNIDIDDKTMPK